MLRCARASTLARDGSTVVRTRHMAVTQPNPACRHHSRAKKPRMKTAHGIPATHVPTCFQLDSRLQRFQGHPLETTQPLQLHRTLHNRCSAPPEVHARFCSAGPQRTMFTCHDTPQRAAPLTRHTIPHHNQRSTTQRSTKRRVHACCIHVIVRARRRRRVAVHACIALCTLLHACTAHESGVVL